MFKRKESIDYPLENIVPGINNVIRIIKNKRRIPRRLFQRSNKLLFIKILDVIVVCSVLFCCTPLYFLVTMVGKWSDIPVDNTRTFINRSGWLLQMWSRHVLDNNRVVFSTSCDIFQAKRREDLEAEDLEILWLEVCPYRSSHSLFIGGVYRPPSFRVADDKRLGKNIENVHLLNKETILLGDINIDFLCTMKFQKHPFIKTLQNLNRIIYINKYSTTWLPHSVLSMKLTSISVIVRTGTFWVQKVSDRIRISSLSCSLPGRVKSDRISSSLLSACYLLSVGRSIGKYADHLPTELGLERKGHNMGLVLDTIPLRSKRIPKMSDDKAESNTSLQKL